VASVELRVASVELSVACVELRVASVELSVASVERGQWRRRDARLSEIVTGFGRGWMSDGCVWV